MARYFRLFLQCRELHSDTTMKAYYFFLVPIKDPDIVSLVDPSLSCVLMSVGFTVVGCGMGLGFKMVMLQMRKLRLSSRAREEGGAEVVSGALAWQRERAHTRALESSFTALLAAATAPL